MPSRDRRLPWLLIPLVAFLAILPLILHGCSCGHDLSFHLLSWQEAAAQFAHGTLHPRWASSPAYGAGEPRFVFYPPLSWTLGGLLTLLAAHLQPLLPRVAPAQLFAAVPIVFTFLALTAAGFAMHHLARRLLPPAAALAVALLYLCNPYTLFTAYERTAFGELFAAALLPLLLAAILPLEPVAPLPILATALPLALLWLTNAPAAVLGSYALAAVILLRLALLARNPATRLLALPLALRALAATVLGLALAAFYIVPAVLERPWVQIALASVPGMRPQDNTLFHQTSDPFHNAVLRTASHLALLLLALAAAALLLTPAQTRKKHPATTLTLAFLTLVIGVFLTKWSLPAWRLVPELAFLQFPWRLLALLAPITTLALGLALPRPLLLALALLSPVAILLSYNNFRQQCDPEDTPQARFALFHYPAGGDPTDEYTPTSADNDALRPFHSPFQLLTPSQPESTPPSAPPGPAPLTLRLHLVEPATLVLNLRDYPTLQILRNGQVDPDRDPRADGLVAVPLPAGPSQILVHQHVPTPEYAADGLSALTLLGVLTTLLRSRRPLTR